jgi:predicted nucleic acid-binding protein
MYKKVFLDANVLIDAYDMTRPLSAFSKQALTTLLGYEEVELYTSCDIITTIYYLRVKQDREKALDDIIQINSFCKIIEFGNLEVIKSCKLIKENRKFKDLEDTLQFVMAQKVGADLILSNDQAFVSEAIELMSTKALCEKYKLS